MKKMIGILENVCGRYISINGKSKNLLNVTYVTFHTSQFYNYKKIDCTKVMEQMFNSEDVEILNLLYILIEKQLSLQDEKIISNN